ncbi:MAG TPA: amidohydrolase family protein [Candidatus Dormibacteraeota bacterium]|jgi:predicted TIM-barrel fold metal-dependent hydrolase|nr:amidohydrolase family protein [Candidatus Dormibacteraeota bacterium]
MGKVEIVSAASNTEVSPDVWRSHVDPEFRDFVPKVTTVDGSAAWVMPVTDQVVQMPRNLFLSSQGRAVDSVQYGVGLPGTGDGAQRLRELDDDGIDAEVLLPPFFGVRRLPRLPAEASIAVAKGYNDWLSKEYTAADPRRLVGVGLLPASTLQDSLDELRRVATLPGVRGLQLQEWPNGGGGPAPEDDAFWSEAGKLGVALVAHTEFGGGPVEDPARIGANEGTGIMFTINFLTTKGGAPYSASQLMTTGVFDRVPELRIYYVHDRISWVEYWAEQADDHYMRHRYWANSDMPHPPSYYIKHNLMHNFAVDVVGLQIRDMLNLDNLMWSRIFPAAHGSWPRTAAAVGEQFTAAGVSDEDRRRLLAGNAMRFFGLSEVTAEAALT